jgi:UDP:flavonoid glycosyltransferase YjiC (YdhE family)
MFGKSGSMNHKKRVLVIGTSVGAGDVPPLLALVTGLIERGNDVLFIGDQRLIEVTRGV